MTEKRFHYRIDEVGVYYYVCDNTKKGDDRIILEFDSKFDAIEVCNVLNSLNDENEQLRTKNNAYIQDIEVFKEENTHLKLENEQLRTALKELREIGDYQADRIQELSDDNEQLKKCNKQLARRSIALDGICNPNCQMARKETVGHGDIRWICIINRSSDGTCHFGKVCKFLEGLEPIEDITDCVW